MIVLRAGVVRKAYDGNMSFVDVLDVISFTENCYENITEYNLLHDVIQEVNKPLPQEKTNLLQKYFPINREYFINLLMNKVIKIDGVLKPISRWKNYVKPSIDMILGPYPRPRINMYNLAMREMSDKGGDRFVSMFNKKLQLAAIPEYASGPIRTDEDRLYVREEYGDALYEREYRQKEGMINSAINHVMASISGKRQSTLHGVNTCRPKYNKKSIGTKMEAKAIAALTRIGYAIEKCSTMRKQLHDCITIAGTPDGYIRSCRVRAHIGMYVEIKAKPYSKLTRGDIAQIYSYWFLTGRPVLLVNYYHNNLDLRVYTESEMKMGWKGLVDRLICNAKRLSDLIDIQSYDDYLAFRKAIGEGDLYRVVRY